MKGSAIFYRAALAALLAIPVAAAGQSRKDVRTYRIRAVTETVTDSAAGHAPRKVSERRFDRTGHTAELLEYRADGALDRRTVYTYNGDGDVKEETQYRGDGSLKQRIGYDYNARGEKTGERRYDAAGNLVRRSAFRYDKKGLKTVRRTFDGTGRLLTTKSYSYHY